MMITRILNACSFLHAIEFANGRRLISRKRFKDKLIEMVENLVTDEDFPTLVDELCVPDFSEEEVIEEAVELYLDGYNSRWYHDVMEEELSELGVAFSV
jgi:hypothetical protein